MKGRKDCLWEYFQHKMQSNIFFCADVNKDFSVCSASEQQPISGRGEENTILISHAVMHKNFFMFFGGVFCGFYWWKFSRNKLFLKTDSEFVNIFAESTFHAEAKLEFWFFHPTVEVWENFFTFFFSTYQKVWNMESLNRFWNARPNNFAQNYTFFQEKQNSIEFFIAKNKFCKWSMQFSFHSKKTQQICKQTRKQLTGTASATLVSRALNNFR